MSPLAAGTFPSVLEKAWEYPCCEGRRGRIPQPIGAVIDSGSPCSPYRGDGLRPGCRRPRSPFESLVGTDLSLEQEPASGFRHCHCNFVPFP